MTTTQSVVRTREPMFSESTRITEALGFPLKVSVLIGDYSTPARHVTTEDAQTGLVPVNAEHRIEIQKELSPSELVDFASHEVYHLFYSVRHLITSTEEVQAEVFGQLVRHIHDIYFDV